MKKQVITQKELKEIQKYWNQQGGFGGETNSGIRYYSSTSCFGRVGLFEIYKNEDETVEVEFYKNDNIESIKGRFEENNISFLV